MYPLPPLTNGKIIRRYKRFLADIELDDGSQVTAHCPNTGAMTTCWSPGAAVQLSFSDKPKRKLAWTLERVDMGRGWVGVNTGRVNDMIAAAISARMIPQLTGYQHIQREPRFEISPYPKSRFDLLLTHRERPDAYVEIKNTTLLAGDSIVFPDAVTARGRKHLELLGEAVRMGFRGIIMYALNRPEGKYFEPAWDVDPEYGDTLLRVAGSGVEVIVVRLKHLAQGVVVAGSAALELTALTSTQ